MTAGQDPTHALDPTSRTSDPLDPAPHDQESDADTHDRLQALRLDDTDPPTKLTREGNGRPKSSWPGTVTWKSMTR